MLNEAQVEQLFLAKCDDLKIKLFQGQRDRFKEVCDKLCINRRLVFAEMNAAKQFATVLAGYLEHPYLQFRIAYLDLSKNNLGDTGAGIIARAVARSHSLVSLNLMSNDI